LKQQIKDMHPSYKTGNLTKMSTHGVDHVESILGCFCKVAPSVPDILILPCYGVLTCSTFFQALVEEIESIARERVGKKSTKKEGGKTEVTRDWLEEIGIKALRDPTLRLLLDLEPTGHQAVPQRGGDTESDSVQDDAKSNTPTKQHAGDASPAASNRRQTNFPAAAADFSSGHLAAFLCAAFSTEEAMKELVQDLKKTNTALKTGLLFPTVDGGYSIEETATSISEQRPDQVTNPAELLLWLVEVRAPPVVDKSRHSKFCIGCSQGYLSALGVFGCSS